MDNIVNYIIHGFITGGSTRTRLSIKTSIEQSDWSIPMLDILYNRRNYCSSTSSVTTAAVPRQYTAVKS